MSSDSRTLNVIVRPIQTPTKAQLKAGEPDNKATFVLKDWTGAEHWFTAELALVWALELDD